MAGRWTQRNFPQQRSLQECLHLAMAAVAARSVCSSLVSSQHNALTLGEFTGNSTSGSCCNFLAWCSAIWSVPTLRLLSRVWTHVRRLPPHAAQILRRRWWRMCPRWWLSQPQHFPGPQVRRTYNGAASGTWMLILGYLGSSLRHVCLDWSLQVANLHSQALCSTCICKDNLAHISDNAKVVQHRAPSAT